ncbi:MAG: hypothetical protein NXH88_17460 [Hyphomonas sp.]|nr:hypothetical protein [Hyphomonas sp.]
MEHQTIVWNGIRIGIRFTPDKFGITDHIELQTESGVPLPVTKTGYRFCFLEPGSVASHGGAVAFVTAWLDHEAARTGWRGAQLSLF